MSEPRDFYDLLAPYYHLIFQDWDASIDRQGEQLDRLIRDEWGVGVRRVLDAAAGIGTQALGLAERGYDVTASDIASVAVARAASEAEARGTPLRTAVADLRSLSAVHGTFDLVIACDNALPHLLTDDEMRTALAEILKCTRPGGGCLISTRDYDAAPHQGTEVVPYGTREFNGRRYVLHQEWRWDPPCYDLSLVIMEDSDAPNPPTMVFRSRYYAIPVTHMAELMREVGWTDVRRIDGAYYQPVLVGTRPA